jgi:formylglycine-generating enzyme required for sulfatase activity
MTEPLTKQGSTEDWLGYGAYADALWARTVRALDKDQSGKPLGDDPLVIGIFGEWGAGKSHLLKLVYQRAQEQSARDIAARVLNASSKLPLTVTVPVMFQPWKYEHEPHLHVPMAIHVADALDDAWKTLPADFEQVKVWAERVGKEAKDIGEKLETAKGWINKLGKFWDGTKAVVKSDAAQVVAGTLDVMATALLVPPVLSLGLSKVRESLGDTAEPADAKPASDKKTEPAKPSKAEKRAKEFSHSTDGLAFYRIEKLIRAMTRPKLSKKLLANAGLQIAEGIEFDLRINFVVFVDDLDRCLPEKAVETLELIKTMFNIESFAFVLALDDEVIERGIGHRYQAYHLAGKKPEMPITGFEYLEKIIHLPFRLPALTREQAAAFVRKYESDIEPDAALRWFDEPAQPEPVMGYRLGDPGQPPPGRQVLTEYRSNDLLELALSGFDAFMPRKLIRLVELLHQVAAIARLRQKPLQRTYAGEVDVRVVLVLLLIQLFQPELFRVMRRRADSFPTLLAAFAIRPVLGASTTPEPPDLPNAQMADIDLWRWAVNPKMDAAFEWKPEASAPIYSYAVNCISDAFKGKPSDRTSAQQVRLPIVLQLIEHRAAQRHVFDVLKLTKRLADEMGRTGSAPHELKFEPYRSLLAQPVVLEVVAPVVSVISGAAPLEDLGASGTIVGSPASPEQRSLPTFSLSDVEELAQLLISPETEAQANMASRLELRTGHVLDDSSVGNLISALNAKLKQGTAEDWQTNKVRILNGLQYLAPFLSREHARAMWELVRDCVDINKPTDPKLRALWGDVRSALGEDERFDPQQPYLMRERFDGHSEADEPIPGFVRIPKGPFTMGSKKDKDNPLRQVIIERDFYINRTLVTVEQYEVFWRNGGYQDDTWWDKQGIEWRSSAFDREDRNIVPGARLAIRVGEMRTQPMNWEEQQAYRSRPVWGVNWFEARAYARWLSAKLAPNIASALGAGYAVMLPTELQWERAARAASLTEADASTWPWGNLEDDMEQQANLYRPMGSVCTVGLFPPSPIGLYDVAGNAWEWMDNFYTSQGEVFFRIRKDHPFVGMDSSGMSDSPALRGGSWSDNPLSVRCSSRERHQPGNSSLVVGFRVVLSLAN